MDNKKNTIALVGLNYKSKDPKYNFYSVAPIMLKACLIDKLKLQYDSIKTNQFFTNQDYNLIIHKILRDKPSIIGFSCYIWNDNMILDLVKKIKKIDKKVLIVIGGPQVNKDARNFLTKNHEIDIIIKKEAEVTFTELIETVNKENYSHNYIKKIKGIAFRKNNNIFETPDRAETDISKLPSYILDKRLLKETILNEPHAIAYETSRGCPYSCNYCVWGKTKIRTYHLDRIKKELSVILSLKNIKRIYFTDANIFHDEKRAIQILLFLSKNNKHNIPVHFELNPLFLTDKLVYVMKRFRSGIYDFGIQTLNPNALKLLNRNLNYKIVIKKLKLLKNFNSSYDIRLNVIYGLPGDNISGFIKTLNFLISLNPTRITINRLLLLPGSEFEKNKKKYGIIAKKHDENIIDYNKTFTKEQMMIASEIVFYINIYFGNKALMRFINHLVKLSNEPDDYVRTIIEFFHYIFQRIGFDNLDFEKLEESVPGTAIQNFENILEKIKSKKILFGFYSGIYLLKMMSNHININIKRQKNSSIGHNNRKLNNIKIVKKDILNNLINKRKSKRIFSGKMILYDELSLLLWSAYGKISNKRKTVPSACARYPLEIYVLVRNIKGLEKGLYKHDPESIFLKKVNNINSLKRINLGFWENKAFLNSSFVIIYCFNNNKLYSKYGKKNIENAFIEVGHSSQNVYLQCEKLKLGTVAIRGFDPKNISKALSLRSRPIYMMPVGQINEIFQET